MVTLAILAAIMGIGSAVIILTLYALHRLTGGKMSLKKWVNLNFDFWGGKKNAFTKRYRGHYVNAWVMASSAQLRKSLCCAAQQPRRERTIQGRFPSAPLTSGGTKNSTYPILTFYTKNFSILVKTPIEKALRIWDHMIAARNKKIFFWWLYYEIHDYEEGITWRRL